ncbi:hypothetical protein [Glycomyces tenuis]|uniref:hypothetical protein n=1 Tax=Glycomyces tenuis TaxID=58116 RepID=UPI000415DC6E|nr:hypothetical protein [Glycomyces tenuis]
MAAGLGAVDGVESHPDRPYTIAPGAIRARGHWIVTYERFDGEDWRNATRTMTVAADKATAVELYTERLVELTDELWSEEDELPLWFEGVVGDYLGYEDTTIAWKGLIPDAAVMAPSY